MRRPTWLWSHSAFDLSRPLRSLAGMWTARAAMTSVFVANGIGYGVWAASLPRLREQLGLDDAQLGIVLFALAVGAVLAMPVMGAFGRRLGTVRASVGAGLAIAVLLPLPAMAPGWAAVLAAAIAIGMASGTMDVAMNAHAAEVERAWGSAIMSSFHAGWSLGGLAGAALAGILAGMGLSLAATLGTASVLIAGLAVVGLLLREGPSVGGRKFSMPGRALMGVGALACLAFVAEGAVADWTGVYLRTDLGVSAAGTAASYAAYSAAMVAGRLLGDRVVRRIGPASVVRFGGTIAACGFLIGLLVPLPLVAIGGFALVGLGLSNIVPVIFSAAGSRGPAGVAMAATVGYGGLLGAPPVIGFVADALGLRVALLLVAAGAGGIAILASAARPSPSTLRA